MKTRILAPLIAALALAGCADTLKDVNQGLAGLNQSLAAVTGTPVPTAQRMAIAPRAPQPTAEQQAALMQALQANLGDKRMAAAVAEATPTIKAVVEKHACGTRNGTGVYLAPGSDWSSLLPQAYVRYHNNGSCLNVARIYGWQMKALNAMSFEVVYLAQDSGESARSGYELVKQPNGEWLFAR